MNNSFRFEPFSAEFARDPYSVYARMRRECPVHYHEDWDTWLLATYEDVKILVMDERLGRTMDHVLTPEQIAANRARQDWDATPAHSRYVKTSILDSEGELHSRLRKAVFRLSSTSSRTWLPPFRDMSSGNCWVCRNGIAPGYAPGRKTSSSSLNRNGPARTGTWQNGLRRSSRLTWQS